MPARSHCSRPIGLEGVKRCGDGLDARREFHHVDATFSQEASEAAKLANHLNVVKAVQPVFWYLRQSHALGFCTQFATAIKSGEMQVISPALFEQAHKLHGLALGAAGAKTADQMQNPWSHGTVPAQARVMAIWARVSLCVGKSAVASRSRRSHISSTKRYHN